MSTPPGPLRFEVLGRSATTRARVGRITTLHGEFDTPAFMPVGTRGTVKGLLPHLVRPLAKDAPQDFLSFSEFDSHFVAGGEYTTCQVESLRALRRIGPPARSAAPIVRAFLNRAVDWIASSPGAKGMPKPKVEAQETLAVLETQDTRTAQLNGNE